jgi:glycosyltransferase involved in cell wall biosynthesis
MIDITFFIPTLNEEKNIGSVLNNILEYSRITNQKIECIFIDDNSSDLTASLISNFIEKYEYQFSSCKIIVNSEVKGLALNFIQAVQLAMGNYFRLINGDNSEPLESLILVTSKYQEVDITIPYYTKIINRKLFRKIISILFTQIINLISGNNLKYYNGAPIYRTEILKQVKILSTGMSYSAEVLLSALSITSNYREIGLIGMDNGSISLNFRNVAQVFSTINRILTKKLTIKA